MTAHCSTTRPLSIVGPVEVIRELLCGPQQHDEHTKGWRWHMYMQDYNKNYLADIASRQAAKRAAGIGPEGLCHA